MSLLRKSVLVAILQVLLVGSIGAKFLIDREQYPRVWIQTRPFDPSLPIRGRYVQLSAVVNLSDGSAPLSLAGVTRVRLAVHDGSLVAIADESGQQSVRSTRCGANPCWVLVEPLTYFISEHAADPSRRAANRELWVEASIPPNGPPRPIQLGEMAEGKISPLNLD
jgi:hypothetical protein